MTAARRPSMLRLGVLVATAALVAGCTVSAAGPDATPVGTVGDVGQLPGSFTETSDSSAVAVTDTAIDDTEVDDTELEVETTATPPSIPIAASIGEQVSGNRVMMIGDSITASISERYGGQACDALVPFGWEVEVNAETGRFIDFGARVLDKRLDAGWDAVVIFLGNNYGYDRGVYQLALHSMLLRIAPRPTVLITTTMFRPQQAEVNAAIIEEATLFDNVSVIDWQTVTEDPTLTGDDGLHLTEDGRIRLGYLLAAALGEAPKQPGKCLATSYRNDSAGSPNGPSGNNTGTKTTVKPTSTTAKPTSTTAKPSTSSSTATTSSSTATTPSTATPTTQPATTQPATTQPATTQPATTSETRPPETTQPAPTSSQP